MSQKSVKQSAKHSQTGESKMDNTRQSTSRTRQTDAAFIPTDLAGKPLKQREYVHLRDKPDFYEQVPNHGKGQGAFKKLHDVPFAVKVEDSLKVRAGRKRIQEPRAQHDIPLKIGAPVGAEETQVRRGRKLVVPMNLPSTRQDRGKRILGEPIACEPIRPSSARRYTESRSVPRETIEYIRLQLEKQSNFEKEVDREIAYRRKTPERKNAELMDSIMAYKFVKFPADKLTDKINRVKIDDAAERSLSVRRSSSYYGKRCSFVD